MIQHLTEIVDEARKRGKKRLAVAYGQDSHTLEAVYEAYKEGIVEPTLFGEKKVIEQVCAENDIDIKAFNIVDEASDVKCVQQAYFYSYLYIHISPIFSSIYVKQTYE